MLWNKNIKQIIILGVCYDSNMRLTSHLSFAWLSANYKQCCLFTHLASHYTMSELALSSPHLISCHYVTWGLNIRAQPRGGNHWNEILFEIRIWSQLNNGLQSGCLGFEPSDPYCGQYDMRHGHSIRDINQSNGPMLVTRCQESYSHSHSRPITSIIMAGNQDRGAVLGGLANGQHSALAFRKVI